MPLPSTMTPIATITLTSATTTVTFSSIPQNYTDLRIVAAPIGTVSIQIKSRLNGDSGTNYSNTQLVGDGTTITSARESNVAHIGFDYWYGANSSGGIVTLDLMNYANTTTYKTLIARSGVGNAGTYTTVGLWRNTTAVNSFQFIVRNNTDTFAAGSTFTIYGIKAAS